MERLTERDEYGNADIIGVNGADLMLNLEYDSLVRVAEALNRLAAYEDTGLMPEEAEAYKMKELVKAAADVRPAARGEWKGEFRGLVFPVKVCGSCNSESPVGRFCINCGADMRGKTDG